MARKPQEEPYFRRLAELMVREDKDVWQASVDLELGLKQEQAHRLMKNRIFQTLLRTERLKFYNELANDPERSKTTLVGQASFCIEKLVADGQYDKALEGILKLAKIEGFVGSDTNVNVFGGLSSKELADLKNKFKTKVDDMIDLPTSEGIN